MDFYKNVSLVPANIEDNGPVLKQDDPYDLFNLPEDALEPQYYIQKCLGAGGFGAVFEAIDRHHRQCAIKIQRKQYGELPPLTHELDIYQRLYIDNTTGFPARGIPRVFDYRDVGTHEFLVMEQCGDSLETILQSLPQERISKKSALMIGIQAIRILETLHQHGILHRDIKPANIVMGLGPSDERTVHLLDFGLAVIVDDWNNYNFEGEMSFSGTDYFASVEALFMKTPTPSGDIQSLAYTILKMVVGTLPWTYNDEDTGRPFTFGELGIQRIKYKAEKLCCEFPELTQFMKAVYRIKRRELPDYDNLVFLLEKALQRMNCENDGEFEWLEPMKHATTNTARVDPGKTSDRDRPRCPDQFFDNLPESKTALLKAPDPEFAYWKPGKISWTSSDERLMSCFCDTNPLMKHVLKPTKEYRKSISNPYYDFQVACRNYENHKKSGESLKPHIRLNVINTTGTSASMRDAILREPASEVPDSLAGIHDYRLKRLNPYVLDLLRQDDKLMEYPERGFLAVNDFEVSPFSFYRSSFEKPHMRRQAPRRTKTRAHLRNAVMKGVCWFVQKAVGDSISNLAQCGGLAF